MRQFKTFARNLASYLAPLALVTTAFVACGDKFGTGVFTQMEVLVEAESFEGDTGTAYFSPAIQQPVFKTVQVVNTGTNDLVISKVAWAVDPETNQPMRNPHIEIDWRGSANATSFPWTVSTSNINRLEFAVKYTPPLFGPPESLDDSVLEVYSNARTFDGSGKKPIVRITFSLRSNNAFPRVTPNAYRYTNATTARPESQDFRVYNDDNASASFRVLSIQLESASDVFRLADLPSGGVEIPAPADAAPGFDGIVFKCIYTPIGGTNDANAILITTDLASNATLRVPLTTGSNPGSYGLSFDMASEFDFTNTSVVEARNVLVSSDGPGPLTLREPRIEPAAARRDFSFKAFVPATQVGQPDQEILQWPRGLNVGRNVRIEVTFAPQAGGGDTANGEIIFPYENPNAGEFSIPLLSGDPKGRLVVAPSIGNISVSGSVTGGDSGTRQAVIYNEGNGVLQIQSIEVVSNIAVTPPLAAKVWSLVGSFVDVDVQPNGILIVPLAYDLSKIDTISGSVTDLLKINYYDDFLGASEALSLGLGSADSKGLANPVADPGTASDYSGAKAGTELFLNGAASSAGPGTFSPDSFIWYLVAKPAGSRAKLNVATAGPASFTPDVAGNYTIELAVFSSTSDAYLYSVPAQVTIPVAAP